MLTIPFIIFLICTLLAVGLGVIESNYDNEKKEEYVRRITREISNFILKKYVEKTKNPYLQNQTYSGPTVAYKLQQETSKHEENNQTDRIPMKEEYEPLGFQLFYKENKEGKPEITSNDDLGVASLIYGDPSAILDRIKGWFERVREEYGKVEKSDFEEWARQKYEEHQQLLTELLGMLNEVREVDEGLYDVIYKAITSAGESLEKLEDKINIIQAAIYEYGEKRYNRKGK